MMLENLKKFVNNSVILTSGCLMFPLQFFSVHIQYIYVSENTPILKSIFIDLLYVYI